MKTSQLEDQHVWEYEMKLRLHKLESEQQAAEEAEKCRLKQLHWMHCPKCGQKLTTEYHGPVEIDLCPSCRGLWLDANELETIVANESSFLNSWARVPRGS